MKDENERGLERGSVIAFRLSPELLASVEQAAAEEGISKSDVARRALIRDRRARETA
jgi:hypothetical protein